MQPEPATNQTPKQQTTQRFRHQHTTYLSSPHSIKINDSSKANNCNYYDASKQHVVNGIHEN